MIIKRNMGGIKRKFPGLKNTAINEKANIQIKANLGFMNLQTLLGGLMMGSIAAFSLWIIFNQLEENIEKEILSLKKKVDSLDKKKK